MTQRLACLCLIIMANRGVSNSCKQLTKGSGDEEGTSFLRNVDLISGNRDIFQQERKPNRSFIKSCQICSCGLRLTNHESGEEDGTNSYVFPWLVVLSRNATNFCLGSLINDLYVLTAASCFRNKDVDGSLLKETEILFPIYETGQMQIQHVERIGDIKVHPNFMPNSLDTDIALLKFQKPVKFTIGISPICLPEKRKNYIGYWGAVTGLGMLQGPNKRHILTQSLQPIITLAHCTNPYYGYHPKVQAKVTKNMMCTAPWNTDLCLTVTGGPLMVEDTPGLTQIVGINSWGDECDGPGKPAVYTKVAIFLDWIRENTVDACFCG